jgi:hypothetical protein
MVTCFIPDVEFILFIFVENVPGVILDFLKFLAPFRVIHAFGVFGYKSPKKKGSRTVGLSSLSSLSPLSAFPLVPPVPLIPLSPLILTL